MPADVRQSKSDEYNGKVEKFFEEAVLLDQPYVRDDSKTVSELIGAAVGVLGENIKVRRFARFDVGES